MRRKIVDEFPTDPFFIDLYIKAGGYDRVLSNAELSVVYDKYEAFLEAKYLVLEDDIKAKFKAKLFEPCTNKRSLVLDLKANVFSYNFSNFQVLENTLLTAFWVPIYNSLTLGPLGTGQPLLTAAQMANVYLTLNNDRQQAIVDAEPIADYYRDTAYMPDKCQFSEARMDWSTSGITFADQAIVTANTSSKVLVMVEYIDMKAYPYMKDFMK